MGLNQMIIYSLIDLGVMRQRIIDQIQTPCMYVVRTFFFGVKGRVCYEKLTSTKGGSRAKLSKVDKGGWGVSFDQKLVDFHFERSLIARFPLFSYLVVIFLTESICHVVLIANTVSF